MADTIKSVLFVDYDSLYLSLRARDPGMARRFASRPGVWLDAIENGLLMEPRQDPPLRRRILMRRCYADPKLLGSARSAFASNGFQIVDCQPLPGRERNSAEIHMVLDTVDALGHATGFEEFILLSADTDLTPLVFRMRAHNRLTTIYSTAVTAAAYRAIADAAIDETGLIALLAPTADAETPETDDVPDDTAARGTITDKDELAALARRIHQATNVPLFSPRVYGELFRALAREVAEKGYHFQTTAENVAGRMAAAGRNASRRQIAFVVKGLALKGHVFSANDAPEKLAEVFKEQVIYLARSSGIELDDRAEDQVRAWIVGRSGPGGEAPALPPSAPRAAQPRPAERPIERRERAPQPRPAELQPVPQSPLAVSTGGAPLRPTDIRPIEIAPVAAAPLTPRPQPRPVAAEPIETPAPPPRPAIAPPRPRPAVRPAAAEPEEPPAPARSTSPIRPPAPRPNGAPATPRPPVRRPAAPAAAREAPAAPEKDPIESSILAAIAEAVDVLVEDGEAPAPVAAPALPPPPPAPLSAEQPAEDDDADIGDEIQRILAAYSQNRKPPTRK